MWGSIRISVPIQGWSSTETKDAKIIGKFEQIEEVKADLTAATANELSAYVNDNGSIISENYDWINGNCTNTSTGNFNCTFNAGLFSEKPSCVVSVRNSGVQANAQINTFTVNNVTVTTLRTDTNALTNLEFKLHCSKQGADVNKSFVGAVINASQSAQEIADIVRTDIVTTDLVKVAGVSNGGIGITVNDDIPFTETEDNFNAFNGTKFTVPRSGHYLINGSFIVTANQTGNWAKLVVDGVEVKEIGREQGSDSRILFNYMGYFTQGQEVSIRQRYTVTLSTDPKIHYINISELPDTTSIVKNLLAESSQTKCQTKVLSANSSGLGIMTDLQFNNLVIGKKYSLSGKFFLDANSNAVFKDGATSTQAFPQLYNSANLQIQSVGRYVFTANTSTIYPQQLTTSTIYGAAGVNNTWVQLCQLPDTVVDTDEW